MAAVLEYQCPCCGAGLEFSEEAQELTCAYCDNKFSIETVKAWREAQELDKETKFTWTESVGTKWTESDQEGVREFLCPSCGGEVLAEENTAASFCPYCGNSTILPEQLSGNLKPDGVIPFRTSREDAKNAFLKLCKGKPLLPPMFTQEQQLEKITGIYVPFWLYDCDGSFEGRYKATRVHTWADARYFYTRTEHYLLTRGAQANFAGIPMDGSRKMEDSFMESIEPFDYSAMVDFHTAYLSGFLADKYDVEAKEGEGRIRQRVEQSFEEMVQSSLLGYASVFPTGKQLRVSPKNARYVLLPVWLLNTRYRDKVYTFIMNGQTGKLTGSLPVCPQRAAAWFAGICLGVTALVSLFQWLL